LFTDGGYSALGEFHRDLVDTQVHRQEVTPALRAAHLGIQAVVLVGPLAVLFLVTFMMQLVLTASAITHTEQVEVAIIAMTDPTIRAKLAGVPELDAPLRNPQTMHRLEELRDQTHDEARARRAMLFAPHKLLLEQYETHVPPSPKQQTGYPMEVREILQWAGAGENAPRAKDTTPWSWDDDMLLLLLLVVPLGMVFFAAAFRGGVSFALAGLALVRSDGRRASLRQCGLRAAVVWFPIAAALFGSALLQTNAPERAYFAAGLWLVAFTLLPIYVVIALRFPSRPPQDRVSGTHLVPT
jgi:hypothetical protein